MKRSAILDPYQAVIRSFNLRGVRYVVIGMAGINYYAQNPAETFSTLDYDVFLEPTLRNVQQALGCLKKLGFDVGTAAEVLKADALRGLVRDRRTLAATTPDGFMVELLLQISGYPFSELIKDAATFTVRGVPIKVGRLSKLLKSKQAADRPKDRNFLRRYRLFLEE